MDRLPLEDPAAVAAMAAGNPAGLESVYRRYADRIYAYAKSIVGDDDTAADVIQETFLLAQERIRQLRDPQRIGSWLYTIARNECLAKLRARKRTVVLAEAHEPVLDTDPGRRLHAQQIRELVHAAAAGMNDGDREVFELTVRHGLPATDVARVLDLSDKHAHARISRARSQFEGALGALVLARDARGRCDELDAIVRDWDGQLSALLRKRIERHARDCATCGQRRRDLMNPAGLLASYAALPFLAVAATLWPRLKLAASPSAAASGGAGAHSGGAAAHSGGAPAASPGAAAASGGVAASPVTGPSGTLVMPTVPAPPTPIATRSNARRIVGAAIAVLLIILGVSAVRFLPRDLANEQPAQPAPTNTASPNTSPPPSPSRTPTPSPTPSPTASSSPSSTVVVPPPPPPQSPTRTVTFVAPLTATVTTRVLCPTKRALVIAAEASAPLQSASVAWRPPPNSTADMSINGSKAVVSLDDELPAGPVTLVWRVTLQATDGRSYTSEETTTPMPCG
jgi:RNA polymerase sigma factor (sigma-70 family)